MSMLSALLAKQAASTRQSVRYAVRESRTFESDAEVNALADQRLREIEQERAAARTSNNVISPSSSSEQSAPSSERSVPSISRKRSLEHEPSPSGAGLTSTTICGVVSSAGGTNGDSSLGNYYQCHCPEKLDVGGCFCQGQPDFLANDPTWTGEAIMGRMDQPIPRKRRQAAAIPVQKPIEESDKENGQRIELSSGAAPNVSREDGTTRQNISPSGRMSGRWQPPARAAKKTAASSSRTGARLPPNANASADKHYAEAQARRRTSPVFTDPLVHAFNTDYLGSLQVQEAAASVRSMADELLNDITRAQRRIMTALELWRADSISKKKLAEERDAFRAAIAKAYSALGFAVNMGQGHKSGQETRGIGVLNYATLKELLHQPAFDKSVHNLMTLLSACVRCIQQSIPRFVDREATGNKSDVVCRSVAYFDACTHPFDVTDSNPTRGYYAKIDAFCDKALITQGQYFLTGFLNIVVQVELSYAEHGEKVPVLVASLPAYKHLFDCIPAGTATALLLLCGNVPHPQRFLMEVTKALTPEEKDLLNRILSTFFRLIPEVRLTGDGMTSILDKWGGEMTPEEYAELQSLQQAGRIKGGQMIADACQRWQEHLQGCLAGEELSEKELRIADALARSLETRAAGGFEALARGRATQAAGGYQSLASHCDAKWEAKYALLEQFHSTHHHCRVPISYNASLYYWVCNQRQAHKGNGGRGRLTDEQIRRLDELGFVWDARSPL